MAFNGQGKCKVAFFREKIFVKSLKKLPYAKSLVIIKNGSRAGSKTFAQTSIPLNATTLYFAGFSTMAKITNNNRIGTIYSVLK